MERESKTDGLENDVNEARYSWHGRLTATEAGWWWSSGGGRLEGSLYGAALCTVGGCTVDCPPPRQPALHSVHQGTARRPAGGLMRQPAEHALDGSIPEVAMTQCHRVLRYGCVLPSGSQLRTEAGRRCDRCLRSCTTTFTAAGCRSC